MRCTRKCVSPIVHYRDLKRPAAHNSSGRDGSQCRQPNEVPTSAGRYVGRSPSLYTATASAVARR